MRKAAILSLILAFVALGCGRSGHAPESGQNPAGGGAPVESTATVQSSAPIADANGLIEAPKPEGPLPEHLVGANPKPNPNETPVDGGTIVERMASEPETLNPLTATDAYAGMVLGLVMDSLASRNPDTLDWEPYLAESWDISQDHLSYVFHLRKGVKWHDGAPFNADDVLYSYQKLMDSSVSAAPLRNYYQDLQGVEKIDDYTVKFSWKKQYFMSLEMSAGFVILPKHVFDNGENFNTHSAGRHPIGTGMYKFANWRSNDQIVLEQNEDYFGRKPHIKRIIYKLIPDDNNAILQASSGALDEMNVTQEQWVTDLMKPPFPEKFNKYFYYNQYYNYIGWNELRPFFQDKTVRRAMTMLVDREGILKNILHDLGVVVTGPFYVFSDAYDRNIKPWPYDPKEARRLLDEAGWIDHDGDGIRDKVVDGKTVRFSFTLMIPAGRSVVEQIATLVQEEMRKSGIEVNLQKLEWAVFIQRINERSFDAIIVGWAMGVEQDPYQIWHSSMIGSGGSNAIGFSNPEADKLIEEARPEFDRAKRTEIYHKFHAFLHEEQPYTFMFCTANLVIVDKRVHNVIVHRLGLDIRDWFIPIELQSVRGQ